MVFFLFSTDQKNIFHIKDVNILSKKGNNSLIYESDPI